jgi:hypothetical protein
MLRALLASLRWDKFPRTKLSTLLLIALVGGVCWFLFGLYLLQHMETVRLKIWADQFETLLRAPQHLSNPYVLPRFVNPVYVPVFMLPFTLIPDQAAILIQLCLTTSLLAALIYKYQGNWRMLVLVLTCYIMFHVTTELNLDWLVFIGLLLPPTWSAPFLAAKPQLAYGVVLSFSRRNLIWFIVGGAALFLLTLIGWGWWPPLMLDAVRRTIGGASWNTALINILTPYVAIPVGLWFVWQGYRKHDPLLYIVAGFFFIPYTGFYSYILPFTIGTLRFPRWAFLLSILLWVVFGPVVISFVWASR